MSAGYQYVDHAKLMADLEADDGKAVAWAYSHVFKGDLGKLVLTHQLAEAGVGMIRGAELPGEEARYHDGRADHALKLLTLAGYGRMSAALAVAADILQEGQQDHDGHDANDGPDRFGGPDLNPG